MTTHNRQATAFARLAEVSLRTWLLLALALVAVQAGVLFLFGQPPICMCGHVRLWQGDVLGPENSQQLLDWYTPSHIIHGLAFYLLLRLVFPTAPVALRFAVALGLEVGWELVENSPAIIERYRQQALAQGYFGDSILNSVSDTCAAALGFVLARKLPPAAAIALAIALELLPLVAIRDGLTLNIIQLIAPSEAISRWQTGG